MNDDDSAAERDKVAALGRGVRLDLVIAVCALLISSVAAGASWWHARVLVAQTNVLQEQLGAQVWPYVSFSTSLDGDAVRLSLANDGLGPAVLRSATLTVDGKPQHNFIAMMHAILGQHVLAQLRRGQRAGFGVDVSDETPGIVLRPGDTNTVFKLTSNVLAPRFASAFERIDIRLCYCAIIPGKCWQTASRAEPQPVASCPEVANDLLHDASFPELMKRVF